MSLVLLPRVTLQLSALASACQRHSLQQQQQQPHMHFDPAQHALTQYLSNQWLGLTAVLRACLQHLDAVALQPDADKVWGTETESSTPSHLTWCRISHWLAACFVSSSSKILASVGSSRRACLQHLDAVAL